LGAASIIAKMLAQTASDSVGQRSMTFAKPGSRGTRADRAVEASNGASVRDVATFVERGAGRQRNGRRTQVRSAAYKDVNRQNDCPYLAQPDYSARSTSASRKMTGVDDTR
jgi:hypothetical protein